MAKLNHVVDHSSKAHFRNFAGSLESALKKRPLEDDETAIERQKRQVEALCDAEDRFKKALVKSERGQAVFEDFVAFICDERRNILDARPYFRERQTTFVAEISPCLKTRNAKGLENFRLNHHFVQFAIKRNTDPEVRAIAREIAKMREELVTINLPLVISRARIFWSKTPQSHLSFMDFVQIAAEGLLTAVDKFVPPYSPAFRSTAIGRMHGNFIEKYSETLIHFYPIDRRKLYRANKAIGAMGGISNVDFGKLADVVNADAEGSDVTTADEIADLMFAAANRHPGPSSEKTEPENPHSGGIEDIAVDTGTPEDEYETSELSASLGKALTKLTLYERKFLALKGVSV